MMDVRDMPSSPSPSASPTSDTPPCPALDSSISTPSSVSSLSSRSVSDGGAGRRRGFMRPHGTAFADSARNRESVMSLGSISHLQYYFARTGLLDGKGGQLAKSDNAECKSKIRRHLFDKSLRSCSRRNLSPDSPAVCVAPEPGACFDEEGLVDLSLSESLDHSSCEDAWDASELEILPPTVSTYRDRLVFIEPLPDVAVLRRELREALDDAQQLLKDADNDAKDHSEVRSSSPRKDSQSQDCYDVQGLHILDIVTLAIRAAKNYYMAHGQPKQLYTIKSERQIRKDLYSVLDILKRMASRNFAGGIRRSERESMLAWTESIDELLKEEEETEKAEREERERWIWQHGDWTGREREREWLFLKSFEKISDDPLPLWEENTDREALLSPFLKRLQNGVQLIHFHNELVRRSKRQFEEIKVFHTDTAKPYRAAENLRYWIKAAQRRWEIRIELDVLAVVHGMDDAAWQQFEKAIMTWCEGVRTEITREWEEQSCVQHSGGTKMVAGIEEDELFSFA